MAWDVVSGQSAAAVFGLVGVVVGSVIGVVGTLGNTWLQQRAERRLDAQRKTILRKMLEDERYDWRELSTLCRVIGTDEHTARRLLVELHARGLEHGGQGREFWGLISRHPLAETQQ